MPRNQPSAYRMLIDANPLTIPAAHVIAESVELDSVVWEHLRARPPAPPGGRVAHRRHQRIGRRRLVVSLAAALLIAVAVAASPTLGFVKNTFLPFVGLEKAPVAVQAEFDSLSLGAPAGMDPRAIAAETRRVEVASFGGAVHALWVAPTRAGGFCYLWTPGIGGCNASRHSLLDAIGPAEPPAGIAIPAPPAGASPAETAAAIARSRALAIVTPWLVGYVASDDVSSVEVRFSDGRTASVPITRVSAPISAGFYVYDVPQREQTAAAHLASVRALDAGGAILDEQTIARGG